MFYSFPHCRSYRIIDWRLKARDLKGEKLSNGPDCTAAIIERTVCMELSKGTLYHYLKE